MFVVVKIVTIEIKKSECRKHPPLLVFASVEKRWPKMSDDDYCGCFIGCE